MLLEAWPRLRATIAAFILCLGVAGPMFAQNSVGTSFGYALQESGNNICSLNFTESGNTNIIQPPLFASYNRDNPQWWYNLVEEAAFANMFYLAMNFRGDSPCGVFPPNGNEPTMYASYLRDALTTRGYTGILKIALFDDTGAYPGHVQACGDGATFDFSKTSLRDKYVWNTKWKPFFDQVPSTHRMKINNRPLVFMWSVDPGLGFSNHGNGNLRLLIEYLRAQCKARPGDSFDPFIIVDQSWLQYDPTVASQVDGVNNWFTPPTGWSKRSHTGYSGTFTTGIIVPGFYYDRSQPNPNMFIDRLAGSTLKTSLQNVAGSNTVLIEGITDLEENAGLYRGSPTAYPACSMGDERPANQQWSYPNQYLNIMREAISPSQKYFVYEAEAADAYSSINSASSTLYRRAGSLYIVYANPTQSQWAVRLKASDNLRFVSSKLGASSNYKLGVRYAAAAPATVRLWIDSSLKRTVTLPATGGTSVYTQFNDSVLFSAVATPHTVKLEVTSGELYVDNWTLNGN